MIQGDFHAKVHLVVKSTEALTNFGYAHGTVGRTRASIDDSNAKIIRLILKDSCCTLISPNLAFIHSIPFTGQLIPSHPMTHLSHSASHPTHFSPSSICLSIHSSIHLSIPLSLSLLSIYGASATCWAPREALRMQDE